MVRRLVKNTAVPFDRVTILIFLALHAALKEIQKQQQQKQQRLSYITFQFLFIGS